MAGTNRSVKKAWSQTGDPAMKVLIEEYNALVDRFDALLAKLDTDGGITDTDYESTIDDGSYAKLESIESGTP